MNILFDFIFFVTIGKIICQQVLNEELVISKQKEGEKINIYKTKIDRRFLEDLDDYDWHVAHVKGSVLNGRRDCMEETFEDKVRRYRKMLKNDGARVEYVSADPIPLNLDDIAEDTCRVGGDSMNISNKTMKVIAPNFLNVTRDIVNISPTTVKTKNMTTVNTTDPMKAAETTPTLDFKATTIKSKVKPTVPKKKPAEKKQENDTLARRASEYMFSSIEYYDESVEFSTQECPDDLEMIELEIDQIRSYDVECEMTLEWRSLM